MTEGDLDEQESKLQRLLRDLSPQERDSLSRFYMSGQTPQEIQRDGGLSQVDLLDLRLRLKKAFLGLTKLQ